MGNAHGTEGVTHTLRGEGFDASEDGTGRGTPIIVADVALQVDFCSEADTFNHADATKANTVEVLRSLRNEIGEEAFSEWSLGILAAFWPQEVLQSGVHGTGLRCPSSDEFGLVNYALARKETGAERLVREMREGQRLGRASFGWEPHEQRTIQLAAYLSELSYPGASGEKVLRDLWEASEGARLLQCPLFEMEEMGRSSGDQGQSIHAAEDGGRGSPGSSVLSAQVWKSISRAWILQQARDARPQRKTSTEVRRLTVTECEFLQAMPRNYTRIPWRGKPAAQCPDGPRYAALGNSMATNCMRWIAQRLEQILR